ncbi:MAG: sulfatase-like hydrolase/transferase [Verrucomicrobiota bacterium]
MKRILIVLLLLSASASPREIFAAAPKPNIIVIITDDHGYADVGFNGAKDITTPNLDRLAKNGTICSSAYVVHPFCGPSRMGLMAGRYPHSFGAPYNLPPSGIDYKEFAGEGIPTDETLISTTLQNAGYHTGAVGKWHLGFTPPYHPNNRGFHDFYGFLGGGHMYFPERYQPIYERQAKAGNTVFNEYITPLEHNGKTVTETEYLTDALSREAVRFVNEAVSNEKPFFLYLAYNAPHTPPEAKEDDLAKFADINDEKRRIYAAMVYAVDRGVGQLVEALEKNNQLNNTLIVFLSDNGGKIGSGADNGPLTQGKGSISEGGIRVPMFFHWPDQVPAGTTYDHPVSALDFYPTFARLAGATIPDNKTLDGTDIWDAFLAGDSARKGDPIFALRHYNGFHNVGARQDEWKVVRKGPNAPWQLFNLAKDIAEQNDLAPQYPERVREMVGQAKKWSDSHTDPNWFDNPNGAKYWKETEMPSYESTFQVD